MITSPTPSRRVQFGSLIALILLSTCGCQSRSPDPEGPSPAAIQKETGESDLPPATFVIEPGPEAQKHAQEALILAQDGDVIEFTAGTFDFDGTLTADGIKNVTVRGKGMEQTILNFAKVKAGKGGEGIKVKADNFVIQDLTLEDTPGDAIKLQDCNGLILRRVKTWWTGGPSSENGAYGIYPVLSNNVLIEHCVASGASDAGIYVGQSKQVVVRHCHAEENVAGIEIENCIGADVYQNEAINNTGGILVFSLPGLTIKNGSRCRIFDNKILSNNPENFAVPGAMVSTVPAGSAAKASLTGA